MCVEGGAGDGWGGGLGVHMCVCVNGCVCRGGGGVRA